MPYIRTIEVSLGELFGSPEWLLRGMDLRKRLACFVRLSRNDYERAPFLDHRAGLASDEVLLVPLDEILDESEILTAGQPSAQFIFHTGHCCSTLFARCLDISGEVLCLREPVALHALSDFRFQGPSGCQALEWPRLFQLCCTLNERRFDVHERVIVKIDAMNLYAPLLHRSTVSRAIFLFSDPEEYLLTGLKDRLRCGWQRSQLQLWLSSSWRPTHLIPLLVEIEGLQSAFSDVTVLTAYWRLQIACARELLRSFPATHIHTLETGPFLEEPENACAAAAAFLHLPISRQLLNEHLTSGLLLEHSKLRGAAYDRSKRQSQHDALRKQFKVELREAHDLLANELNADSDLSELRRASLVA